MDSESWERSPEVIHQEKELAKSHGIIGPDQKDIEEARNQTKPTRLEKLITWFTKPWAKFAAGTLSAGASLGAPAIATAESLPPIVEQALPSNKPNVELSQTWDQDSPQMTNQQEILRQLLSQPELAEEKPITNVNQLIQGKIIFEGKDAEDLRAPLTSEIGKPPSVDFTSIPTYVQTREYVDGKNYFFHSDQFGLFTVSVDENGNVDRIELPLGLAARQPEAPYTANYASHLMHKNATITPLKAFDGGTIYAYPERGVMFETDALGPSNRTNTEGYLSKITIMKPINTQYFTDNMVPALTNYPPYN